MSQKRAFTLVELLVVIGIIAVLISILLPAMNSARRAANTVKCAAALKQIGNATLMYVQDSKGYLPASSVQYANYKIGDIAFNVGSTDVQGVSINDVARWSNLIAKYLMKSDSGVVQNAEQMNQQLTRSVVWGCPSFQGFVVASNANSMKGDVNRNYLPYAVNRYPTMTASWPEPTTGTPQFPTPNAQYTFEGSSAGTWYKLVQLKNPTDRALMADARWSTLEARAPLPGVPFTGQPLNQNQATYVGSASRGSTYDFYRHGKVPPVADASSFASDGGKVAYNILYADMHVATATDRETGYKALRMRFPL